MDTPPPLPKPTASPRDPVPWYRPIGALAMILGVLGMLWGGIRIAQAFVGNFEAPGAAGQEFDQEAVDVVIAKWQPTAILTGAIYIPVGLILLVGGILLVRKRPLCVPVIRVWAILKLIAVGVNGYFQYLMASEQLSVVFTEEALGSQLSIFESISDATIMIFLLFSVIWMSVLPIFMLFWFGRVQIRSEIVTWKDAAG